MAFSPGLTHSRNCRLSPPLIPRGCCQLPAQVPGPALSKGRSSDESALSVVWKGQVTHCAASPMQLSDSPSCGFLPRRDDLNPDPFPSLQHAPSQGCTSHVLSLTFALGTADTSAGLPPGLQDIHTLLPASDFLVRTVSTASSSQLRGRDPVSLVPATLASALYPTILFWVSCF